MKNSPESKFDKISANARESSESKSTQTHSKLAHFPIMLFASVMGIGGLALAFKKASVAFGANADFIDLGVNFA